MKNFIWMLLLALPTVLSAQLDVTGMNVTITTNQSHAGVNIDNGYTLTVCGNITLTLSSNVQITNGNLILKDGAKILLSGNYIVQANGETTVNSGSMITLTGNFENYGGTILINGTVQGNGSFINENGMVTINGQVILNGSYTNKGGTTDGTGSISAASILTDGGTIFGQDCSSGCGTNLVPIELYSFSVHSSDDKAHVQWTTSSETNNDYFTLEKSRDGLEYFAIARVKGAGTSTENLNYSFVDNNPFEGISYYRLMQTDFDGTFEYSDILTFNNKNSGSILNVFPNPVKRGQQINIFNGSKSERILRLYNLNGALILEQKLAPGMNNLDFDNGPLGGLYLAKFVDQKNNTVKVIQLSIN